MTGLNVDCKECELSPNKTCNLHEPYGNEEALLLKILKSLRSWKREPPPPPLWTLPVISSDPSAPHPPTSFLHYCLLKNNQLVLCSKPWDCKCAHLDFNDSSFDSRIRRDDEMGSKEPHRGTSRKSIMQLAKQLKNNCDKIFDSSIPFVIDICLLRKVIESIDSLTLDGDSLEWRDLVMFLSDICTQTPSLCISSSSSSSGGPGNPTSLNSQKKLDESSSTSSSTSSSLLSNSPPLNLALFKSLSFLELRNTPVSKIGGLTSIRSKLKRAKCSRCITHLSQLFGNGESSSSTSSSLVPAVWPELKEVDLSLNFISGVISPGDVDLFTLLPSLEILNLSRNRITSIDSSFSRGLNALCVLNLSYNQLTHVPPIPPTVEQLYLSHNYISTLITGNNRSSTSGPASSSVSKFTLSSSVLKNLKVLDLSTNLLAREEELGALQELGSLEKLNLMGNPISFLDNYRNLITGYLHRWVVSRKFELDRKPLSSSEVRWGIEKAKEGKFVPYVPANSLMISQAMSSSAYGGGNGPNKIPGNKSTGNLANVKSLTQSYDSSTSSVRSSRRKKAKIREIVETTEEYDEESRREKTRPVSRVELQASEIQTRTAVAALREKYGAEHWLLTQAGGELERLLHIPARPQVPLTDLFSRSLPPRNHNNTSSAGAILSTTPKGNENFFPGSPKDRDFLKSSSTSSSLRDNNDTSTYEEEFYSCFSQNLSSSQMAEGGGGTSSLMETSGGKSIFDSASAVNVDERFEPSKISGEVSIFSVFQSGEVLKLIIHDGYLLHTDGDFLVICKWDLNCLTSLEEERCDAETESVEFRLKFDTMRKQMRERSFIMGKKDFRRFDSAVSPFIEVKALEEFTEALQCTKCYAQFARAMAKSKVKVEGGRPNEVNVCPTCDCDILVTLDAIPLPNNECLEFDEVDVRKGPLRTSTPVSVSREGFGGRAASISRSIPKQSDGRSSNSPRIINFLRQLPSSLTLRSRPSPPPVQTRIQIKQNFQEGSLDDEDDDDGGSILRLDKSDTPSSSDTVPNAKSDSDIEVLSNDSSSIEVLAKQSCGESSASASSDVEAEEALEVPMLEGANNNLSKTVVMSESTSSSSCADSIVTTYERQQQNANVHVHVSVSSSLASTSTLTSAKPSPKKGGIKHHQLIHTSMPIRYDYVNFGRTDHRLQLWSEISLFKSADERLLALVKCVVISDPSPKGFSGIVIFSSKKVYIYKIQGPEGDKPQDWLQKVNAFDLTKFAKLDVLIGRHGVGVDFSGKYFAFVFRDSERTSSFLEYFMSDICGELSCPPVVRDFSQNQKTMLSPTDPITYFGILRLSQCESPENVYTISAILVTNEETLLITDLSWMAGCCDTVSTRHGRRLSDLRQVESMESDPSYLSLVFGIEGDQIVRWELAFETPNERKRFESCVRSEVKVACVHEIPFICLSQPLEP